MYIVEGPCILLQVYSYDEWERHRLEGYGHCNIPSSPGNHGNTLILPVILYTGSYRLDLSTWRPSTASLGDHLTRYFIGGGTPSLRDTSYLSSTLNKVHHYITLHHVASSSIDRVDWEFKAVVVEWCPYLSISSTNHRPT